ncbi:pre-mRNA-splicing factor ATP-dependent RNA helicase PRP43 [Aureobasidium pullulans]|nr:pre-mRNA-splicing factor ATP-dependent RNA helicase PRP43 [Aureobasidium pullulans]
MSASASTNMTSQTGAASNTRNAAMRARAMLLPVRLVMGQLMQSYDAHQVLIIRSDTGSGKSTQIPQAIYEACSEQLGQLLIGVTQPRRLATHEVAARIADEMDVRLGELVGYHYKGSDRTNATKTRIVVETDGTLLSKAKKDKTLSKYGVIIIDEAHQHTTSTDLLLGLLKQLLPVRPDLKVVIMSATMDAKLFEDYFPGSKVETVAGKPYKLTHHYLTEPVDGDDLSEKIVETILFIALTQSLKPGNVLVFVSGVREINAVISGVEHALNGEGRFTANDMDPLECYPLHSKLSFEDQQLAVNALKPRAKNGRFGRKIIVATNIAETSITINRVTHVIDSGMAKSRIWNPRDETSAMRSYPISQADAAQRAGRAGRTDDGDVWHMYTEKGHKEDLIPQSVPPTLGCDMTSETLTVQKMNYRALAFPYIIPPATETMVRALGILEKIGAIDSNGKLLQRGDDLCEIPLDVYSSLTLMESVGFGCSDEVTSIVAMLDATKDGSYVYLRPADGDPEEKARLTRTKAHFRHHTGDHLTLLNIFMGWKSARRDDTVEAFLSDWMLNGSVLRAAEATRMELLKTMRRYNWWTLNELDKTDKHYHGTILRALMASNFLRVAKRVPGGPLDRYQQVSNGFNVVLNNTDLRPSATVGQWVFFNDCFQHPKKGRAISVVSSIKPEMFLSAKPYTWWDAQHKPPGHIKDALLIELNKFSGWPKEKISGGMPPPTALAPVAATEPAVNPAT